MSSFYGGASNVSAEAINNALGFTPVMYEFDYDEQTKMLEVRTLNNAQTAASEQNIYIQLQDIDTTPCLILTYHGRRFKFTGEEIL